MPVTMPQVQTTPQPAILLYDSGVVAAGAQIISPKLDTTKVTWAYMLFDNSLGDALRPGLTAAYADDGTTLMYQASVGNIAIGAKTVNWLGPSINDKPMVNIVKVTFGAGGTGPGRLVIYGR